ncbi:MULTISPECIES: sarcosine oxidase subunit gamma [Micrococcaceae]|uniref:sarcosine oxidase subunit gamma n=1 Tax=Micrococcaceae TaxID=1268 RepID=UPI001619450E|nr:MULTISPECIES: sarcosine oxidase subunit gamma family protein [Micrococcaceae]MBB5750777.1 sarcosine oxidase subunit gamma [Micrococcus sp. TA1]HRO30304.1 sarcosine oxidase subunit gamma family protein [Citricoccus sp.]HRO93311.1 sarcosine oxidase subunit gamma family protein [Citricoccus sp.]
MAENTMTIDQSQASGQVAAGLRRTPAAHLAAEMAQVGERSQGAVSVRELAFPVQLGLRARPNSASATALEGVLGVSLPTGHGQVTGDPDGLHVVWLSPDEFLAVDVSREQVPGEGRELEDALEGLPGQAVDISANRSVLDLRGPRVREVLEKGCHADLHPRSFGVGTAIATQLGPVPVVLHRYADSGYRVYPRASFADYLVRWVLDAAEEFCHEEVL